jgi:outer membrane immunogenic protein
MRKLILAALVGGCIATPAFAQDGAPFTGLRVEGLAGWDRVHVEGDNDNGVAYGVGVGYDVQMGGAVVGVEGEAAMSTMERCAQDAIAVGDELCADAKRDFYAGGRIGGVIGTGTLLYAKAGYTNARFRISYDDGTVAGLNDFDESGNFDGVRVGGGVEHSLGTNAFLKAEYRYSNYEGGLDRHQVVGGFGFRF